MEPNTDQNNLKGAKWKAYLKKIGLVGLLFFLVKGLIWVYIFFVVKSKIDP